MTLLTSCATISTVARATDEDCICYTKSEVEDIAAAIIEMKKCEIMLKERERLIEERLTEFKGPQEGRLFWQDPAWFGFGIAGSFFLGILTAKLVQK